MFACAWMLFGLSFYSYLFGIMYQMINDYDKDNELLQADLEVLNMFQHKQKLPITVYNRIKRQIENKHVQKKFYDSEQILKLIPAELKSKILLKTHKNLIQNIPFFQNKNSYFVFKIVDHLKPLNLGNLDFVYTQRDAATNLYFILKGYISLSCNLSEFFISEELSLKFQLYQELVTRIETLRFDPNHEE